MALSCHVTHPMYEDSRAARVVYSCKMFRRKRSPIIHETGHDETHGRIFLKTVIRVVRLLPTSVDSTLGLLPLKNLASKAIVQ